jgi:hypothetical protein
LLQLLETVAVVANNSHTTRELMLKTDWRLPDNIGQSPFFLFDSL